MLKKTITLLSMLLFNVILFGQAENYPVYKDCENQPIANLEKCFLENVKKDFNSKYVKPTDANDYQNEFYVVFIANKNGEFDVIHVSSNSVSVNKTVEKVFSELSPFQPAVLNGQTIDKQFILYYPNNKKMLQTGSLDGLNYGLKNENLEIRKENSPYRSNLNYWDNLSLHNYQNSDQIHTGFRPYLNNLAVDTNKFDSIQTPLLKDKKTWLGRKFWNENFVEISDKYYWININPIFDVIAGKDNSDNRFTYNNTRGARIDAGLWNKIVLSSTFYESQARFVDYFNDYAFSIKPGRNSAAVIPGQVSAREFGTNGFDYQSSTGYVSYSPNKTFNFQFGRDKNFIGDGYRSLFLSDATAPSTFFKIQTNFWKIQYTNLWMFMRDVRREVTVDNIFLRKFAAIHHLSLNATKKLNISLFESVIWAKSPNQGFDVDYINPLILYRPIEYAIGSKHANVMLGLSTTYKLKKDIHIYSQLLFDEITKKELFSSSGYWGNKYAFQLGAKYFNAFHLPNLNLQMEYNTVRPYVYSHEFIETNYGTYNQSLAHPWGSNFREGIFIVDYKYQRWFVNSKIEAGLKGFDYNSTEDTNSYGGDIFRDYADRNADYGINTGQGNKAKIVIGDFQAGYLINPSTNLKVFGGLLVRSFNAPKENTLFKNKTSTWFNFGFKYDLNNWYFDF